MNSETKILFNVGFILIPFIAFLVRIVLVLPSTSASLPREELNEFKNMLPEGAKGRHVMVLLGSGGHTGEMINILRKVDMKDFNRTWVISSGDSTSIIKSKDYEQHYAKGSEFSSTYLEVVRARKVGEPLVSSVKSTIKSFVSTVNALFRLPSKPDVLILNGPGTSVPLAYIIFLMKVFGVCSTKIIYVESLARVNKLSLSGMLCLPISDRFIVQWQQLFYKYKRAEYYGILI